MVADDQPLLLGPAESRLVRTLFYFSEGLMAGSLFYIIISIVFFILYALFSEQFMGLGLLVIGLLFVFFLLLAFRNTWAIITANREGIGSRSLVYEEWTETRRWLWIFVTAIPVTGILIGSTIFLWGWTWWDWHFSEAKLLWVGVFGAGLLLRMLVRVLVGKNINR